MNKLLQKHFHLSVVAVALLAYHLGVIYSGEVPNLRRFPRPSLLHFEFGKLGSFNLTTSSRDPVTFGHHIDPSAKFLAGLGYLSRYQLHETPDLIFRGTAGNPETLYLREELKFSRLDAIPEARQHAVVLNELAEALQKQGVTTVFIPVATKISAMPSRMPDASYFESVWAPLPNDLQAGSYNIAEKVYRAGSDELKGRDVNTFKIFEAMRRNPSTPPSHIAADSHWTPYASAKVARDVALRFEKWGWSVSHNEPEAAVVDPVFLHALNDFQLPDWFLSRTPRMQQPQTFYNLSPGFPPPLAETRRIILFGSSYSTWFRDSPFGFAKLLSRALGSQVIDLSYAGKGAVGSPELAREKHFHFRKGDILVWEYPIRLPVKHREELTPLLVESNVRDLTSPR